jgi:outer membrane protein assembly factor BamB
MSQRLTLSTVFLAIGLSLVAARTGKGEDWPTFRGPQRTSVVEDNTLLKSWPQAGPKLLWTAKGAGRGYASLAIVDGKIYTLGDGISTKKGDAAEYLTCFQQSDGEPLWSTKTGAPWNSGRPDWQGSRSTPTVAAGRVYVISPEGSLLCCQASDGKELWRMHLKNDFKGKKADVWGYSESVLVDGDLVLCTPGGPTNTVVALEANSGATRWACSNPDDRGAGHASIVISRVNGRKVYVQTTGSGLMGVSDKGELLWTYPIGQTTAVIPTPIVKDDLVFMPVGYKRGGALVRQVASGNTIKLEEIYGLNTKLANKHGGVVLVGKHLYADSDDAGIPYCADLMTGQILWTKRGSGRSSAAVIAASDRLYFRFSDGTMVLAEARPDDYVEVSKFKIPGSGDKPSWSHPVILDGKLYLREQDQILCYDLRNP